MTEDAKPRRRFLQALAIVPASTLAVGAITTGCSNSSEGAARAVKAYEPTYFTAPEWAFVQAAVDHLIPSDQYGPGALEAGVPEFIDRQMETPTAMASSGTCRGRSTPTWRRAGLPAEPESARGLPPRHCRL